MAYIDTVIVNHMKTDYRKSEFLIRLGLKWPVPVVYGRELLIRCEDGSHFAVEEVLGLVDLPTPDEIYKEAERLRSLRPNLDEKYQADSHANQRQKRALSHIKKYKAKQI